MSKFEFNPEKKTVNVAKLFRHLVETGEYDPEDKVNIGKLFMCNILFMLRHNGKLSESQTDQAIGAIKEFLTYLTEGRHKTITLGKTLCDYITSRTGQAVPPEKLQKLQRRIYQNWDKRKRTVELEILRLTNQTVKGNRRSK